MRVWTLEALPSLVPHLPTQLITYGVQGVNERTTTVIVIVTCEVCTAKTIRMELMTRSYVAFLW